MAKPVVRIYCDGGCSPNPGLGGWGVVLLSDAHGAKEGTLRRRTNTTNNRMELLAAIRGLEALKRPSCWLQIPSRMKNVAGIGARRGAHQPARR